MYDEIKVTEDNIVELSQFKVGDTVTLLKKIENAEGIYNAGHVMKIDMIDVYRNVSLPKKPFDKFKNNYKVNESMFYLRLIDTDSKNYTWCDTNDVIKGKVTGTELEAAIKKRKAKYAIKYISSMIFVLMAICFFILSIIYGEKNKTLITFIFLAISFICLYISVKILVFKKRWRRIKTKECNSNEKKE